MPRYPEPSESSEAGWSTVRSRKASRRCAFFMLTLSRKLELGYRRPPTSPIELASEPDWWSGVFSSSGYQANWHSAGSSRVERPQVATTGHLGDQLCAIFLLQAACHRLRGCSLSRLSKHQPAEAHKLRRMNEVDGLAD